MKRIGGSRKTVLIWLNVVMMVLVLSPIWGYVADAATREENIQKIETFLTKEAVVEKSIEKGISPEKIEKVNGQLNSLSDAQLERLAENLNLQVGGALEDDAVSSFWKTWGLIIIIATVVPLLLMMVMI